MTTGSATVEVFDPASKRDKNISWIQSQSHIATDGQSVSKLWRRASSGAHGHIFITVWQLRFCFLWDALSDERTDLSVVYAASPCLAPLFRLLGGVYRAVA
jgi:hypothetical protein